MNKKITTILLTAFVFLSSFINTTFDVDAATGGISITGPNNLQPGETATYKITLSASETAFFSYSVNGSNLNLSGQTSNDVLGNGDRKSETVEIRVKAGNEGTGKITVSGTAATTGASPEEFGISGSKNITIKKAPSYNPSPANPSPSQPNPSKPSTPSTTQQKSPEQLKAEEEARKKAAEEERKAAEEKKKEELKKTPLFSSFDVMSLSDKRFEEVLETVATKFNVFEYEYQLPKNIDRFRLDFEKIDASVKLEYEKDHEFKGEEKVISVPVKATKGDVSQSFTIKIKRDDTPVVKQKVDDKEYVVFDDDALDGFMKNLGFKRETLKDGNNFYYEKDNVKLQLLVDEEFNGRWYLLNDKNEIVKPVTIMKLDGSLLVVSEAPEEYRKNTINDEKYEKRSIDYDKSYTEVHPKLNVETSYYSWKVDKGEVVFGMDSSGEEGFYFVSSLKDDVYQMEKAFVGFDKVDGKSQKIAMVSSFAFLGLMSTNLVSYYKKKKRV